MDRYRPVMAPSFRSSPPGCADLLEAGHQQPLKPVRTSAAFQAQLLAPGGYGPGDLLIRKTQCGGLIHARCSQRTVGRDAFRQDRRRAFRASSGMTGWSWWRGANRRTLFRLAWKGYAPGRGSSFVSSSSGSTPPSRCCSCLRRISCIKAASRASSSAPGSWPGFSPELPGGCSGSPMARFSSNPGPLAQYPAISIALRDHPRPSCPVTSPPTGSSDTIRGMCVRSLDCR